jgi:hypothetical protein
MNPSIPNEQTFNWEIYLSDDGEIFTASVQGASGFGRGDFTLYEILEIEKCARLLVPVGRGNKLSDLDLIKDKVLHAALYPHRYQQILKQRKEAQEAFDKMFSKSMGILIPISTILDPHGMEIKSIEFKSKTDL